MSHNNLLPSLLKISIKSVYTFRFDLTRRILFGLFFTLFGLPTTASPSLSGFLRPRVIFTFDDVYQSVYELAFPILKQKKIPATAYVATKWASDNNPIYMKWPALHDVEDNGWEIAAHTVNHPVLENVSLDVVEQEVKGSKEALESEGFHPVSFAVPYGSYNDGVLAIIHKYFKNNRGFWTGDPFANPELRDWLHLNVKQVSNETRVDEVRHWIDQAVSGNQTLILVFHIIEPNVPKAVDRWGYSLDQFSEVASLVEEKRDRGLLDVMTIEESMKLKGENLWENKLGGQVELHSQESKSSVYLSPTLPNNSPDQAYFLKVYVDSSHLAEKSKFNIEVEEHDSKGNLNNVQLLQSDPSTFMFAQTYIPSSPNVKYFRIVTRFSGESNGPFIWDDLKVMLRQPINID